MHGWFRLPHPPKCRELTPEERKILKPAAHDPRFPGVNKAPWCSRSYYDYFRCRKIRGEDYEPCNFFKDTYEDICPSEWIERWDDQRRRGVYGGLVDD